MPIDELEKELKELVAAGKITEKEAYDMIADAVDGKDVREEQRIYNETMLENCSGDML